MISRLHLIDGTWELFRAHFSKRPDHRTPSGKNFKATAGVVSSMLGLLHEQDEAVTHIAIAFDNPIRSFRNDLFAGYKTEDGVDPELLAQFDDVEEAMRALGLVVWRMGNWECDDGLASGAAKFRDAVEQVRICSPDKDLGQCIRGTHVVQINRMTRVLTDEAALRANRGIVPESIPDLLALVGDTADGIPGLDGFGEKGAAAVLARWIHFEAIPDDHREWQANVRGSEKLARTLRAHRAEAALYKKLATLVEDVPLAEDLDALAWRGIPRARFGAWAAANGLDSLLERPYRYDRSGV